MTRAYESVQIQEPALLSPAERTRDRFITAVMWFIYLYLWVPLLSLFAWLLGFEFAYDVMVRAGGARELANVAAFYAVVIVAILCIVTAWSLGNRFRYRHLVRRVARPCVSAEQIAEYFDVDITFVESMRAGKSSTVTFDTDGQPLRNTGV